MIKSYLQVQQVEGKGKGVFTQRRIPPGKVIEESPVIVMNAAERLLLDKTLLHDYIFEWGDQKDQCCLALGLISLYNHDYQSNCEYYMDFEKEVIQIKTVKWVEAGEELSINYNGDWNDPRKVWFQTREDSLVQGQ